MDIILNIILTFIGTLAGYIFGARKNNAQTDGIVIKNVKEILEVYSQTINDLKTEITELKLKISQYEEQISCLNKDLVEFRKEMRKNVKNN